MKTPTPTIMGTMTHTRATALGVTVTERESRSFERALCRRLVGLGHTGRLELRDAETGKPRLMFPDITRAAKREAFETATEGPGYRAYRETDWGALRAA